MRHLLRALEWKLKSWKTHPPGVYRQDICPSDLDPDLCRQIRASILLAGPMIARFGDLVCPHPEVT